MKMMNENSIWRDREWCRLMCWLSTLVAFLFACWLYYHRPIQDIQMANSRLVSITNAHSQRIVLLPSQVTRILPDFGDPHLARIYLEGNVSFPIMATDRGEIERRLGVQP